MTFGHPEKTNCDNDWSFDSSEISTIWRLQHLPNASLHIFETFRGIKNASIYDLQNPNSSIICKLELVGISTFFRLEQ